MINKATGSIVLALGLLVALTPRFILPVCEWAGKKTGMLCGWSGRAEIFVGVIIASMGIAALLSKSAEVVKWLMPVVLVSGISVILIPEVIGFCASAQMPCNYGTIPLIRLLGGTTVLAAIVIFMVSRSKVRSVSQ